MSEIQEYLFTCPYIIEKLPDSRVRIIEYSYFKITHPNPGETYYTNRRVPVEPGHEKVISEQDYNNWMDGLKSKGFLTD